MLLKLVVAENIFAVCLVSKSSVINFLPEQFQTEQNYKNLLFLVTLVYYNYGINVIIINVSFSSFLFNNFFNCVKRNVKKEKGIIKSFLL